MASSAYHRNPSAAAQMANHSRAQSGVSRLALMQARFQAQQLADREEKMINLLEQRQEEVIRRTATTSAYGKMIQSQESFSTNSASSNNSSNSVTAGLGSRPAVGGAGGRVRQMFAERRRTLAGGADFGGSVGAIHMTSSSSAGGSNSNVSPVGWDKSYPLKPVNSGGRDGYIYRRNATTINGSATLGRNKYSGNYGPRRSNSQVRGQSLDRNKYYEPSIESGYSSTATTMNRTRSHHQIGQQQQQHGVGSSGEDSYGALSRPNSRANYSTYNGRGARTANGLRSSGAYDDYDDYDSPPPPPLPPAARAASSSRMMSSSTAGNPHSTYTREYIKNLPPASARRPPLPTNGHREPSPPTSGGGRTSGYEHSSFSSQSSEKSDPPAFTTLPRAATQLVQPNRAIFRENSKSRLVTSTTDVDLRRRSNSRSRINSRTYSRKSRSPEVDPTSSSRSPSHSPVRRMTSSSSHAADDAPNRLLPRRSRSTHNYLANGEDPDYPEDSGYGGGGGGGGPSSAYRQAAAAERAERAANREREEEKRRMQAEMRRREQELLERIKKQQKELETVKQEKTKVERELHRQEVQREKDRRLSEEKRREDERERREERDRARKERMDKQREQMAEARAKQQQQQQARQQQQRQQQLQRRSSFSRGGVDAGSDAENDAPIAAATTAPRSPVKRGPFAATGRRSPAPAPQSPRKSAVNGARPSANGFKTTVSIGRGDGDGDVTSNGFGAPPSRPPTQSSPVKRPTKAKPPSSPVKSSTSAAPARRSLFASKPRDDLSQCANCGRNFAHDRIEKHTQICTKTSKKKRKVFDSTKIRTQGTDAASYNTKYARQAREKQQKPAKKSDWRKKRADFINALRAAKEAQRHIAAGGKVSDLPPPPPSDTSDYIQCPHCQRRFNEAAAERHIPKCKNIKSNKR